MANPPVQHVNIFLTLLIAAITLAVVFIVVALVLPLPASAPPATTAGGLQGAINRVSFFWQAFLSGLNFINPSPGGNLSPFGVGGRWLGTFNAHYTADNCNYTATLEIDLTQAPNDNNVTGFINGTTVTKVSNCPAEGIAVGSTFPSDRINGTVSSTQIISTDSSGNQFIGSVTSSLMTLRYIGSTGNAPPGARVVGQWLGTMNLQRQ